MAYSATVELNSLEKNRKYKNAKGNHECVTLVQQAGNAPHTSRWKKGSKVMEMKSGEIPKGTIIATFDEVTDRYPTNARHAAFYISHSDSGIWVYDQWNSRGMSLRREIAMKRSSQRDVNDANCYYIVE